MFCLQSQSVFDSLKLGAFLCVSPFFVLCGALYRALANRLSRYSREISVYLNGDFPYSSGASGKSSRFDDILGDFLISSPVFSIIRF